MPRTTFYERKNVQVTIQPNIGLDATARQSVVDMLNLLLADEAVLLLKTRHADKPADGSVPDLHPLYDAQLQQMNALSSEMTERVHILGGALLHEANELMDSARLGGEPDEMPGIIHILADHEAFIRFLREDARKCSEMYEDQGTFALLISVMRTHEKMAWSLRSNIAFGQAQDEE